MRTAVFFRRWSLAAGAPLGQLPMIRQGTVVGIRIFANLKSTGATTLDERIFLVNMGRLGATVAGTIRVLLVAIPKLSTEKRRLQMNKFRFTIKLLVIATFLLAFASIAQAQATRTWVSGVGDDVNPCSRTAPCKTFAGAISKTAAGGEIDCLDPGGFGAVTITKSITIDCGTVTGGILAAGTNGVNVNAAGIVVRLRGLVIQ